MATGNNSVILAMNSFVWVSQKEVCARRQVLDVRHPADRQQLAESDAAGAISGGGGFADSYYQPFILGWNEKTRRRLEPRTGSWRRPATSSRARTRTWARLLDPRRVVGPDVVLDVETARRPSLPSRCTNSTPIQKGTEISILVKPWISITR